MITYSDTMYVEDCCNCGMKFAMSNDFRQRMRDSGKPFYCPAGHQQRYTDTTVARLTRRVATLDREADELRERVRSERASKIAEKAAKTRVKNRAKRGVCQYCNRTVKQMAQHVEEKHPEKVGSA